jgi:predicted AAA+ superfamily ATPase
MEDSALIQSRSHAEMYRVCLKGTATIAGTKALDRNSNLYGASFEQFIGMEIRAYLDYRRIQEPLTFWRTTNGVEVDFLIGEKVAIEVKSTARATEKDEKGLRALQEEGVFKDFYLVTQDCIKIKKTVSPAFIGRIFYSSFGKMPYGRR